MESKGAEFARVETKMGETRLHWGHLIVADVPVCCGEHPSIDYEEGMAAMQKRADKINTAFEKESDARVKRAVEAREKELLDTLRNYFVKASWCRTEDYIKHPIGHAISLLEAIKENQDGAVKEAESRVWEEAAKMATDKARNLKMTDMVGAEILSNAFSGFAAALRSKAASS